MVLTDVAKQAVREVGKYGPDGPAAVGLFTLAIIGLALGVAWWKLLATLLLICAFYDLRRSKAENHAVLMATLSANKEAAKIEAIKAPHRQALGLDQPQLPLERKPRRLR